jgi:hypothetical protein
MRIASQKCVKWLLVRKGTILFVSQTTSQETICESLRFAKEFVDLNKSQTALQAKICEGLCVFFYLLFYGDRTRGTRGRLQLQKMTMGQEHGKEHLFEHVDALLVSGFGWD